MSCSRVFIVDFEHVYASKICLTVIGNHVKRPDMLKSMKNRAMFSSLEQTPFLACETDKIQGNHLVISELPSTLQSALESAFQYNYSLLHSINHLQR